MAKDYDLISFLMRGKRRRKVLNALNKPKTPKDIAQECGISTSNVSNALAELQDKEMVECITKDAHFFRFYSITTKGKALLKQLENKQQYN